MTAPRSQAADVVDPLVKTTMHIGSAEDSFLDSVQFAGRSSRPKVDASRSAVVRLAISQLAERMTPAEIVQVLASNASKSNEPGRKRR